MDERSEVSKENFSERYTELMNRQRARVLHEILSDKEEADIARELLVRTQEYSDFQKACPRLFDQFLLELAARFTSKLMETPTWNNEKRVDIGALVLPVSDSEASMMRNQMYERGEFGVIAKEDLSRIRALKLWLDDVTLEDPKILGNILYLAALEALVALFQEYNVALPDQLQNIHVAPEDRELSAEEAEFQRLKQELRGDDEKIKIQEELSYLAENIHRLPSLASGE